MRAAQQYNCCANKAPIDVDALIERIERMAEELETVL